MTGLEPLVLKQALQLTAKGIHELGKPVTQDKLVVALKRYPTVPKLSWGQRRRLKTVIGSVEAANALMDQDPAGAKILSAAIADKVFREPESERSRAIADALITEYPGCVDGAENAILVAYQLRLVRQALETQDDKIDDIGQTIIAVHTLVAASERVRIDPEVLLNGPLDGLKLQADYQKVLDRAHSDPSDAARRLSDIIERIEKAGHTRLARRFREQYADLLAGAGQFVQAADAWLPMVDDYLTAGYGYGPHDAVNSWEEMATHEGAPAWLQPRRGAVIALEHCCLGDLPAGTALQAAIAADHAADPAAPTWLLHAAEACLTDNQPEQIEQHRERLMAAAATTTDPMVALRLKLAVADATGNEQLWQELLSATIPGGPGSNTERAALIHARRGRNLFWDGQFDQALAQYRTAAAHGTHSRHWQDAANWFNSARHILSQAEIVNYDDLKTLGQRETALLEAGPGSLLEQGYDLRATALTKLVGIDAEEGQARSTRIDLRRYLRRSIVLGELNSELDAHQLLGRLHLQMGQAEAAVPHFITAGDVTEAGSAAAKLTTYYDCHRAAQSPIPGTRAAALHAAFRQADLIPDDLTAQWARTALDEAKRQMVPPLGPNTCLNGYEVLQGLANRFPDDLIAEFLRKIDPLLPRTHGYRSMDEHMARILVGLGRNNPAHHGAVAERIATAFEEADDLADIIVNAAPSLSKPLTMIKARLQALLKPEPGRREAQTRHAALALVEIGDQSPELLAVADDAVTAQLDNTTAQSAKRAGNAEETAILAACLPVERRTVLARHYCARILDTNDTERHRAIYASACRIAAEDLPAGVCNELFDQLFPLRTTGDSQHPSDVAQRQFQDRFGFLRVQTPSGRLRRQVAKTLAVLAADEQRQDRAWKAAQQLAVSGESIDANTVGDVGYTLAKKGFAPHMPWDAMACSSDSEMRRLAAALIPFTPDVDAETIMSLARDRQWSVRRDLAEALGNMSRDSASAFSHELEAAVDILRCDPSYRVRNALGDTRPTTDTQPM
jgi:tetratricopeptide (TPR) repeat protein